MKVSGFSFIRNALKFDYPIVEAIRSVLPLCDEFVVAVGKSEDGTESLIRNIPSPKIKIINTVWDDSLRKGGKVLADETNKAFAQISNNSDWAFYIQGDEVLHEKYIPELQEKMERWKNHPEVEGLLFNYLHFYGSYDYAGDSRRWYRREIRIVRNDPAIKSFGDAQGFRKNGRLLKVKPVDACIYHYGWVKPPVKQQEKQKYFHKLWHSDRWVEKNISPEEEFDYSSIDSLKKFRGSHPKVMQERVKKQNWKFDFDPTEKNFGFKNKVLHFIEDKTGWRPGEFKDYRII